MRKRMLSLLLALTLAASLAVPAFAADVPDGSVPVPAEESDGAAAPAPEPENAEQRSMAASNEGFVESGICGEGGNLTWTLSADGTLTISGSGRMENCAGASAAPWHKLRYAITGVVISTGVTHIGDYAFDGCGSLVSVTIPMSVSSIGAEAFNGCSSLTGLTIPTSVGSIGEDAFHGCERLVSITIPGNVKSVGNSAFYGCTSLVSVTIQDGVTVLGDGVFSNCTNLTSVSIPSTVTTLGSYLFLRCGSLQYVSIPGTVVRIGDGAFSSCSSLTGIVIPGSVTSIGESAFLYSGLTAVTIPASVLSIGSQAFAGCTGLAAIDVNSGNTSYSSVDGVLFNKARTTLIQYPAGKIGKTYTVPKGVTSIGYRAFSDCSGLTAVTIPAAVTRIGDSAFENCSSKLVIYGSKGSAAETYAGANGISFSTGTAPGGALTVPNLTGVSGEASGIKVTWSKVSGAAKYRVFYKPAGGSWAKAGDTTATSYTWTGAKSGTTYQIRVRCISADGKTGTSDFSATKSIKFIAAPQNVTVSNVSTGIKISWTKSAGAARYRVYYKAGSGSWKTLVNTTATSYTWKSAGSGTKYTFRVRCVNSAGTAVTSGYAADKSITYIAAPKNVTVSGTANGVKISWTKSVGAEMYRIYYKTGDGSWKILTHTTAASYTWAGAKSGTRYTFRVRCVNSAASYVTSSYTADKSITFVAAPKGVTVSSTGTGIKVTWGKVTGAVKYRVFYKPAGGSWTKAGDTTATSYTWTGAKSGTTYQMRVRCISSDGETGASDFSASKSVSYIAAPKNVTVSGDYTGIKISWTKSAGAAKYRVYYKAGNGGWKTLTHTTADSYTWTGAKSGTTYTFRVRCVNSAATAVTSSYTADKTIVFKPTKLAVPKNVKVSNDSAGIKVSWGAVNGAVKYRVFYKPAGGSWTKAGDTYGTSYVWTGAKSGTAYQMRVRCISYDGKTGTSDFSAAVSVTFIAAPKNVTVSGASNGIKISWSKVTGAAKYRVYYKVGSGGWNTLVNTDATSYTWTGAKSGTAYTFRVRCLNSAGTSVISDYDRDLTFTYVK